MDIKNFLAVSKRGTATVMAREIGVSAVMVSQWAAGVKRIPLERCTAIEEATGGRVRRWDLRPGDWHRVWPELVGAPGAPGALVAPAC